MYEYPMGTITLNTIARMLAYGERALALSLGSRLAPKRSLPKTYVAYKASMRFGWWFLGKLKTGNNRDQSLLHILAEPIASLFGAVLWFFDAYANGGID